MRELNPPEDGYRQILTRIIERQSMVKWITERGEMHEHLQPKCTISRYTPGN